MKEFSFLTRQQNIEKLQSEHFDILIIGGGITGAGVARDAALRGLKVALVEGNDFASGTSSRSSKLIHGGIRYLENLEFHLVFEALNERTKLFQMAPNLVHPLRFMIPIFQNSRVGMIKMGLGMWLYDALSLFQTPQMHERLDYKESLMRMPILQDKDLKGSFEYSDAYMDDDRLVIETLRSAHEAGAVIVSYTKALRSNFSDKKVSSIEVQDQLTDKKFNIYCQQVICTVGPWTDLVGETLVDDWKSILRPTKGIHLTFKKDRLPITNAVVMAVEKGNRIVFAIPRHEMIIIGTTDTDFSGNPSNAAVTSDDVKYLLQVTNQYFPNAKLQVADIVSSYAGVRPLVKDESATEGKTSREHIIIEDLRGFTFVAGGKYTTYRLMSQQVVDKVIKNYNLERRASLGPCITDQPLNSMLEPEQYHLSLIKAETQLEKKLAERYGMEAYQMIAFYGNDLTSLEIEACHSIEKGLCFNLVDFFTRRTHEMLAEKDHGLSQLEVIADLFQEKIGWTEEQKQQQIEEYRSYIKAELAWRKSFNFEAL